MTKQLEKYLPYYPPIEASGAGFTDDIYHLKEFYMERVSSLKDPFKHHTNKRELKTQQKIVSRFISGHTPYKGLLVYHGTGTGKTCASFAIAEACKQSVNKIVYLSPNKGIADKQKEELKNCFPIKYGEGSNHKLKKWGVFTTPTTLTGHTRSLDYSALLEHYKGGVLFILDEAHEIVTIRSDDISPGRIIEKVAIDLIRILPELIEKNVVSQKTINIFTRHKNNRTIARKNDNLVSMVYNDDSKISEAELLFIYDEFPEKIRNGVIKRLDLVKALKEGKKEKDGEDILVKNFKSGKKNGSLVYTELKRLFEKIPGARVVLLSATPMTNIPSEFYGLMNLILPIDKQLTVKSDDDAIINSIRGRVSYFKPSLEDSTKKEFINNINMSNNGICWDDKNLLLTEDIKKVLNDKTELKLSISVMSKQQTKVYLKAWCNGIYSTKLSSGQVNWIPHDLPQEWAGKPREGKIKKKNGKSVLLNPDQDTWLRESESASTLVYHNKAGELTYGGSLELSGNNKLHLELVERLAKEISKQPASQKLNFLYNFSPKYSTIIDTIINNPKKKIFIYNENLSNGGNDSLEILLNAFKYRNVTFKNARPILKQGKVERKPLQKLPAFMGKRFIKIDGNAGSIVNNVLKIFNDPRNAQGEYIQIVIGSSAVSRGVEFKDIQIVHVVSPPWNYPTLDQALGRVLRLGSHKAINNKLKKSGVAGESKIKLYLHAAVPMITELMKFQGERIKKIDPDSVTDLKSQSSEFLGYLSLNSSDIRKYINMEDKDKELKRIEHMVRTNSFDCPIFYNLNLRKGSLDYSRECDYEECEYDCKGVSDYELKNGIEEKDLYKNNYDLFYLDSLIENIVSIISKTITLSSPVITAEKVMQMLNTKVNIHTFNIAIVKIMDNNMQLTDALGNLKYIQYKEGDFYISSDINNICPSSSLRTEPYIVRSDKSRFKNLGNSLAGKLIKRYFKHGDNKDLLAIKHLVDPITIEVFLESILKRPKTSKIYIEVTEMFKDKLHIEGDVIRSTLINGCERCYDENGDQNSENIFCKEKVAWLPVPGWKDCDQHNANKDVKILHQVIRKAFMSRNSYIGVGLWKSPTEINNYYEENKTHCKYIDLSKYYTLDKDNNYFIDARKMAYFQTDARMYNQGKAIRSVKCPDLQKMLQVLLKEFPTCSYLNAPELMYSCKAGPKRAKSQSLNLAIHQCLEEKELWLNISANILSDKDLFRKLINDSLPIEVKNKIPEQVIIIKKQMDTYQQLKVKKVSPKKCRTDPDVCLKYLETLVSPK